MFLFLGTNVKSKEIKMKFRNGFVSNSSSSSFVFMFKGDSFEDLEEAIVKHFEFPLRDNGFCSDENISFDKDEFFDLIKPFFADETSRDETIRYKIVDCIDSIRFYEDLVRKEKKYLSFYENNDVKTIRKHLVQEGATWAGNASEKKIEDWMRYVIKDSNEKIRDSEKSAAHNVDFINKAIQAKKDKFSFFKISFGSSGGDINSADHGSLLERKMWDYVKDYETLKIFGFNNH